MTSGRANKYQPALVVLHWTLAWFIIASLAFGFFVLRTLPNTDPHKIDMLEWHMGLGMAILAAMLVRALVRWRTARPAPAGVGTPASARVAGWAHVAFYLLVGRTLVRVDAAIVTLVLLAAIPEFGALDTVGHLPFVVMLLALILHGAALIWCLTIR